MSHSLQPSIKLSYFPLGPRVGFDNFAMQATQEDIFIFLHFFHGEKPVRGGTKFLYPMKLPPPQDQGSVVHLCTIH